MIRKTDAGADYTDVVFTGGTYVEKNEKGAMTPTSDGTRHIRSVFRGPNRRSLGWGSIQVRLARIWSETMIATELKAPHTPSRPKASSYSHSKISPGPGGPIGNVHTV